MFFCPYGRLCPMSALNRPFTTPPCQSASQNNTKCQNTNRYTIKPGDTFYKISKFFNVSPDDLLELNPDINPDKLYIGQNICIPINTVPSACPPNTSTYVVKEGDTFYKIAKRFNVTISALIKANSKVNPDALLVGLSICIPKQFNKYTDTLYKVAFMYPLRWVKINDERYEGIDGFFQLSAISSTNDIEAICQEEAHHKLKPYGSKPVVAKADINGQPACFIYPSSDQPMEMREQAALIIKYPNPVVISAQTYSYFILWADKNHIKGFAGTLKFLAD